MLQITDYLPYGKERITQRNSDYKNKYGFIGKEKDNESGLNYVEARYYDSNLGRFVAQDKMFWELGQTKRGMRVMMDPQQMNSYGYARNNPIVLKDPSGENPILVLEGVGIAAALVGMAYTADYFHEQAMDNLSKGDEEGAKASISIMIASPLASVATDAGISLASSKLSTIATNAVGKFTTKEIEKNLPKYLDSKRIQHAFDKHAEEILGKGSNQWSKSGEKFTNLIKDTKENATSVIRGKIEQQGGNKWTFDRYIKDGVQVDIYTSGTYNGLLRTVTKANK